MTQTHVNQVLPSETSTQEEGDTIHFSVKCVENYKFVSVASIEILTKLRQEQQDADAMESQQVRDKTKQFPFKYRLSIISNIYFTIDHSSL